MPKLVVTDLLSSRDTFLVFFTLSFHWHLSHVILFLGKNWVLRLVSNEKSFYIISLVAAFFVKFLDLPFATTGKTFNGFKDWSILMFVRNWGTMKKQLRNHVVLVDNVSVHLSFFRYNAFAFLYLFVGGTNVHTQSQIKVGKESLIILSVKWKCLLCW